MNNGKQSVFRQREKKWEPRNKQAALIFTKAKPFHLPPVVQKIVTVGTIEDRNAAWAADRAARLAERLRWADEKRARKEARRIEKERERSAKALEKQKQREAQLAISRPEPPDISKWISRGKRLPMGMLRQLRESGQRK